MPERQEGHLLKKRKWPLKGWHKVGWAGQRAGQLQGRMGICWRLLGKSPCVWLLSPHTLFSLGHLGPVPSGQRHRDTLCLRMAFFAMQLLGKM